MLRCFPYLPTKRSKTECVLRLWSGFRLKVFTLPQRLGHSCNRVRLVCRIARRRGVKGACRKQVTLTLRTWWLDMTRTSSEACRRLAFQTRGRFITLHISTLGRPLTATMGLLRGEEYNVGSTEEHKSCAAGRWKRWVIADNFRPAISLLGV